VKLRGSSRHQPGLIPAVDCGNREKAGRISDAIETTLGWDTIYEPSKHIVVSPVSRVWSVHWGGYVLFDWDTFFAATMAGIGDRGPSLIADAYRDAGVNRRSRALCRTTRGQADGKALTARSRRWERSLCWVSIKSFTIVGFLEDAFTPAAALETAGGQNIAISKDIWRGAAMGITGREIWTTPREAPRAGAILEFRIG